MKKMNFVWMFLGTGMGAIMGLLMNILLARNLEKSDYGIFGIGLTFINILSVVIGFGVADFIVKSFAVEGRRAYRYVNACISLFTISFTVTLLLLLAVVFSPMYDFETKYFLLLIVPNIFLQGIYSINNSVNQIEENFRAVALSNFLLYFVRFFAAVLAVLTFKDVIALGWYLVMLSLLAVIPFWRIVRKLFTQEVKVPVLQNAVIPKDATISETFKETYPFGLIGIFYFIYYQSNVLLLSFLVGKVAVGEYNAAFAIIQLAFMFPDLIFRRIFYTRIHVWATHDPNQLKRFNRRSSIILFILGVIGIAFIWLTAKYLILFTAGEKYLDSVYYLQLLSLAILFKFATAVNGTILSTQHMVYKMMRINAIIAILNLVANIILIPIFKVEGAIYATLISEFTMAVIVFIVSHRYLNRLVENENKLEHAS
ncbi:flippase [Macrococcus equi]|uniref:flippase n=1 Tax=Macrococcus equi TaxID=3395462 RepID=UPI0039BE3153